MKWMRPSGREIETNELPATIEYCKSLGWDSIELVEAPPITKEDIKEENEEEQVNEEKKDTVADRFLRNG